MTIKIESGVEIPKYGITGQIISTLNKMEVGQSFVCDTVRKNIYHAARKAGCKVTVRKCEKGGWRAWRIT